jgi:hypothetical protein
MQRSLLCGLRPLSTSRQQLHPTLMNVTMGAPVAWPIEQDQTLAAKGPSSAKTPGNIVNKIQFQRNRIFSRLGLRIGRCLLMDECACHWPLLPLVFMNHWQPEVSSPPFARRFHDAPTALRGSVSNLADASPCATQTINFHPNCPKDFTPKKIYCFWCSHLLIYLGSSP